MGRLSETHHVAVHSLPRSRLSASDRLCGARAEPAALGRFVARHQVVRCVFAQRRLWLRAWSAFMSEPLQLGHAGSGPRWEGLDQLVKSFAAVVDDPDRDLQVPLRR